MDSAGTTDHPDSLDELAASQAILTLQLQDFRNYDALKLEVDARPVVLVGPNGAGKTNILEAISLLTPGKGLRKARFAGMVRQDALPTARGWTVSAEIQRQEERLVIGTAYVSEPGAADKRLVRVRGEPLRSQAELAQYFSALWLTPQMDQLFNEAKSERRKFLDRLVFSFDPAHASRVNGFEHAMRERNRLLATRRADATWLGVLEEKIAAHSVAIAAARLQTLERLNDAIDRSEDAAFAAPLLEISGDAESLLSEGRGALQVETELAARLAAQRPQDMQAGRTGTGAHRSSLLVWHNLHQREAEFCSTGEQKAMLMSIILAHAQARTLWCGSPPVLLLDEVVSHLDRAKRAHLATIIRRLGAQVWMTGTDAADFRELGEGARVIAIQV